MKYILLFVLLVGSSLLMAHPASNVELEFDQEASILTVNFDHKVKNAEKHFITEIIVSLNEEVIIEQKLEHQDNFESGNLIYKIIDAKPGDNIKVKTKCSKIGNKTATIILE